jgi:hypothetical protein
MTVRVKKENYVNYDNSFIITETHGKERKDTAEHFRELSIVEKRTGADIDLCKA